MAGWSLRIVIFVVLAAALLNANWAQGALVVSLRAQPCSAELLQQAQGRVALLFGEVRSKPLIGCLQEPAFGVDVSYGQTRFAPLLPAVVLLGPQGQNLDVAAHEWVHAELSARVGVLARSWRLPTWFDEGLAMQVDERPEYDLQGLAVTLDEMPNLAQMRSASGFFSAQRALGRVRYGYARCVVAGWLASKHEHSKPALGDWLQELSLLRDFPVTPFQPAADACRAMHVEG